VKNVKKKLKTDELTRKGLKCFEQKTGIGFLNIQKWKNVKKKIEN